MLALMASRHSAVWSRPSCSSPIPFCMSYIDICWQASSFSIWSTLDLKICRSFLIYFCPRVCVLVITLIYSNDVRWDKWKFLRSTCWTLMMSLIFSIWLPLWNTVSWICLIDSFIVSIEGFFIDLFWKIGDRRGFSIGSGCEPSSNGTFLLLILSGVYWEGFGNNPLFPPTLGFGTVFPPSVFKFWDSGWEEMFLWARFPSMGVTSPSVPRCLSRATGAPLLFAQAGGFGFRGCSWGTSSSCLEAGRPFGSQLPWI